MCDDFAGGHKELWIVDPPPDEGPEGNMNMWFEAESVLDQINNLHEGHHNNAVVVALADAYNRCIEERRRAEDLLKLHKAWDSRRIGGVGEPESAVRAPE